MLILRSYLFFVALLISFFSSGQDAYYTNLKNELESTYGLPSENVINSDNEQNTLEAFSVFWQGNPLTSDLTIQEAAGQPFSKYLSFTLEELPRVEWHGMITSKQNEAISQGDKMLLTFWARSPQHSSDKGYFSPSIRGGSFNNSKSVDFELDGTWQQFFVPWTVESNNNDFEIRFTYGTQLQTIEIAGVAVLNYQNAVNYEDLPKTENPQDYRGRSSSYSDNLPWLNEAKARIDEIRKADLKIDVVDGSGNAIEDVNVQVDMLRHEFPFGTAHDGYFLFEHYRRDEITSTFLNLDGNGNGFNNATNSLLKWDSWSPDRVDRWVKWCLDHDVEDLYGHTIMWGDKQSLPNNITSLSNAEIYPAIRQQIEDVMTRHSGQFKAVDVLNETYLRRIWENDLGYNDYVQEVKTWFDIAHTADPEAELNLNDNRLLSDGTHNYTSYNFYKHFVADLLTIGTPLTGLGLQAHVGRPLGGPVQLKKKLDSLATIGLKLHVTEFDIAGSVDDEVEADYVRDFYTIAFSHPEIHSIKMWGAWDEWHWLDNAVVFDENYERKPSGQAFVDLLFKEWWTNASGATDPAGDYMVRGFKGDYSITIEKDGYTKKLSLDLIKDTTLTIDFSDAKQVITRIDTTWEPFNNWDIAYSHTNGFNRSGNSSASREYDDYTINRSSISTQEIVYAVDNMYEFSLRQYIHNTQRGETDILIHHPDSGWFPAVTRLDSIQETEGGWKRMVIRSFEPVPEGTDSLKIVVSGGNANWSPHLSNLWITSREEEVITYTQDMISAEDILIYPNPTQGQLFYDMGSMHTIDAKLFSGNGALKQIYQNLSGKGSLNLTGLSKGMYFLQLEDQQTGITYQKKITLY